MSSRPQLECYAAWQQGNMWEKRGKTFSHTALLGGGVQLQWVVVCSCSGWWRAAAVGGRVQLQCVVACSCSGCGVQLQWVVGAAAVGGGVQLQWVVACSCSGWSAAAVGGGTVHVCIHDHCVVHTYTCVFV